MLVQTLSVVVPTPRCINDCPFCVSKMGSEDHINQIEKNKRFIRLYQQDYIDRLQFARDNGCNTVILTGDGEALQNEHFLIRFSDFNTMLGDKSFRWIELQSTGVLINDEKLRFLRDTIRVNTISLSVSDLFDSVKNCDIIKVPQSLAFDLKTITSEIKRYDFNLRISVNMLKSLESRTIGDVFVRLKELGADQVIFRKMYSVADTPEGKWLEENGADSWLHDRYRAYIEEVGTPLEVLPFGATRYSLHGISTVLDPNCMPQEATKDIRYLVLRPNCKLYTRWDDKASLIF